MGGLFKGPGTQITTYSGLQVQTTSAAVPVTIMWGRNMFTPNVIWYNGFTSKKKGAKGGGKGGLSSIFSPPTETVYYADIIMALCEGPITDVAAVYQTSVTPITLAEAGLGLVAGELGQAPWSFVTANYPSQALGYSGIAYVCAANFDLGPSASVGSNSFVVDGLLCGTGFNAIDADPALVIQDFLTNAQYGVGFPAASIDTTSLIGVSGTSSLQAYCWALGFAFSPILSDRETANTILDRWLQLMNATAVWSSGQLKFIPRGDETISGNGWEWAPNLTVQFALTDEDYCDDGDNDPIQIEVSDPYSASNRISIEIVSRNDNYNTGPIEAFDQSAIDRFGLRVGSNTTAHEICDIGVAQTAAQLILQRGLYIRRTFTFKLSWEFGLLDPMDIVSLTDLALGLDATIVRFTDIDEADDGELTFVAEEMPIGVATTAVYPVQAASNGAPNFTVAANPVNTPVIIEPPPALTSGTTQVWVGASGQSADPNWGGAFVWASLDGVSYAAVGTIPGAATQGVTTATLATYSGVNPDTTDTLSVDLTESGGVLASTTSGNAAGGASLCYVGGEYIAYTTATLTAANKYNLTGLYRGLYNVAPQNVPSGSAFMWLAGQMLQYTLAPAEVGSTIYLKLQSFNIFGEGVEDLSTCAVYEYSVSGSGSVGAVTTELALGISLDYGLASVAVTESDDWGTVLSLPTVVIGYGHVTS